MLFRHVEHDTKALPNNPALLELNVSRIWGILRKLRRCQVVINALRVTVCSHFGRYVTFESMGILTRTAPAPKTKIIFRIKLYRNVRH